MSVIVIPARMASTRLPGKPIRKIAGVPMILRVAERCMQAEADRVIVATDAKEILEICEQIDGLECTMTADDIQSGTDRIARVAKFVHDDIIINVQGDEPFIEPALINALINDLKNNPETMMNTAACEFTVGEDVKDPNSVKVVLDKNGFALYFSRLPIPFDRDGNSGATYYKHIGIYGFRKSWLMQFAALEQSMLENAEKLEQLRALESGVRIKVIKTDYKPVSIDTEEDLTKAEEIMGRKI